MHEEDLDELYELAPCGYMSTTLDGTIVKVNGTLAGWLGRPREELIGRPFQDLLTVPGRIFHDTHYMPLLAMQGFVREIALDLERPGREPLPTIISSVARKDADGRVQMYRTTLFDCSQRRSYERELLRERRAAEQAADAKTALLAMLSHDMRSPLGSIMMACELLEELKAPEQERYLGIVKKAAGSVMQLVDAILEHSTLEAGGAAWQPQDVDLRSLVAEIAAIHSVKTDAKRIALEIRVAPELPWLVRADRFKLSQIITNLLSNAVKFTEAGGVALDVSVVGRGVDTAEIEICVTDTGVGIPPEKRATIFDEYDRGADATARRYGGTGLGLAIVRRLVALAGGTIDVESEVGRGSTFRCTLRLPVVDAEQGRKATVMLAV